MSVSNTNWNSLYKIAAVSALLLLVYSLVTMVLLAAVGGMPETTQEGFDLLAENRLVGLCCAWVGVVMHGLDLLHIVTGISVPAAGVR